MTTCTICPHACVLDYGQTGLCRARKNMGGHIVAENYGKLTAVALDPIEKKPLRRFYPGSSILSVGSYGCNFKCGFCQNNRISMADGGIQTAYMSPEELVSRSEMLADDGNIGIAFTYNEPLVGYEYVRDTAVIAQQRDQKVVLVTNGYINEQPLVDLLPYVDAMNIDLKAWNEYFYRSVGGDLPTVKRSIRLAADACHVEVTTLIIPEENDSEDEMADMAKWLSEIDPELPLHVSRFFPQYKMADKPPTPVGTIKTLADIARRYLKHVYQGNC